MTLEVQHDVIGSYLESDARLRTSLFSAFIRELREEAAAGDPARVREWACRAVSPDLDFTSMSALSRLLTSLPPASQRGATRLAVLGGPTTTQLVSFLKVFSEGAGVPLELHEGDYGTFRQQILVDGSPLDQFRPKIVFIATGAKDLTRFPALSATPDAIREFMGAEFTDWKHLWQRCLERWGAAVIQNTFEVAPWGVMGHLGARHPAARERYISRLNELFAERAPAHVALHDLNALALESGANQWFDPRFYLDAKMPCGPEALVSYAHSVARVVAALAGKSKKALVLDLDNTLWGGVIGDAGLEGIEIGQGSGVGEAFVEFQKYARDLRDRGILLAVCSKNDPQNARLPFEKHDGMILRLKDISCFVANWQPKPDNLREIARTLEIGLDSLVFVDDNPAERAIVRRFLPEVAVPDMPDDPAGFILALAKHRYFESTAWTAEDAQRAVFYERNAQRKEMAGQAVDLDSFLQSLQMRATVGPVTPVNLERVAQLVNKSNQFNVTTRRRTAAEIEGLRHDPRWTTLTVSLSDKLGDNGLISVVFLQQERDELLVDTWLMSCRVLQRGVEDLVLNEIVSDGRRRGCRRIRGTYIRTERNSLVRDLFVTLGFEAAGSEGDTTHWALPIDDSRQPRPTYIQKEAVHA